MRGCDLLVDIVAIKSSKKTRQRRRLVTELDALARQRCFERDGHRCVHCGSTKVQWCHVISRRHLITRWELDNALSGCAAFHMWWHSYSSLSGPWFRSNYPDRDERITGLYNRGGKVDLQALLAELKG